MAGITDLLAQTLQGDTLANISQAVGAPEAQTRDAAMAALPLLLGQMRRNASTPQGAQALQGALERDHDGGLLDNIGPLLGMLGGAAGAAGGANPRALNGAGILGHIFGGRQPQVEDGVARASGLDRGQVVRLLMMLAPIVMAALARQRNSAAASAGAQPGTSVLQDILGQATSDARQRAPGGLMGALSGLLDRDGDGSVIDDLAGGMR
jgi:hypothetical protein